MSQQETIVIYTDGGSRGNPGPSGIGIYIETLNKEYAHYIGEGTNNEAEYEAVIFALKKLKSLLGAEKAKKAQVAFRMDSELAVKQLNHEYKLKDAKIQQKFLAVWNAMIDFDSVSFTHIPREQNKHADALANRAMDEHVGTRGLF